MRGSCESALGRRRIACFRRRGCQRFHVGFGIVVGHDGSLLLVGDNRLLHTGDRLETGLHGVRAGGAIHILYRQGPGFSAAPPRGRPQHPKPATHRAAPPPPGPPPSTPRAAAPRATRPRPRPPPPPPARYATP